MASKTLTKEYVQFIDNNGILRDLVQDVIDRMQYSDGFLQEIEELVRKYDSPFELIESEEDGKIYRSLKNS
jgi:hypothetical protein